MLWAAALGTSAASAAPYDVPPWPTNARWHLSAQTTFDSTRWQGVQTPLERTDVQQRLRLSGWPMRQDNGRPRLSVQLDLTVGSDLGPEPDAFESMPDGRRVALDLMQANLKLHDLGGRVDVLFGRTWFLDALGADALDGVVVQGRLAPHFLMEVGTGLAVRRAWSLFGPDLFSPDGTRLPDTRGQVIRARLATHGLSWLDASAGLTRQFDDAVQVHRAAGALRIGPQRLHLDTLGRYDLIQRRVSRLRAAAGHRSRHLSARAGWRRSRPSYSADSIWNAFVPVAHDAWFADAQGRLGAWTLAADGAVHLYPPGDATAQTPGLPIPVAAPDAETEAAFDVGARVERTLSWGSLGATARRADGFGGARTYGDVFTRLPMPTIMGRVPGELRARVGGVRYVPTIGAVPVTSGWALLAGSWRPEETMRLDAVAEWHASNQVASRLRIMGRLTLEDWW
ncbi:MAG: hypothetical protein ACI9U2_000821 [Bradymonadia bacterium]|jgi:hypothetical protein